MLFSSKQKHERALRKMSLSLKFFSLALAAAFILPAALAVMGQAAQIVV